MSKLYDKYEKLKLNEIDTIYLFLCGNFYIALDSDAIILNELFDMKLTKFSNECDKCGFPKGALGKYESILKEKNIKYKVISEISDTTKLDKIKSLVDGGELEKLEKDELVNIVENIKSIILE